MKLQIQEIQKSYFRKSKGANHFLAVAPVCAEFLPGTLSVLTGRSGSGKTTFLHMLGGLLSPDAGSVLADETDLYALPEEELSRWRNAHIGIIPQGQSAIPSLTVLENVLMPAKLYHPEEDHREAAIALLERFGIGSLQDVWPAELSGGEMRRMAVARALLTQPEIVLADEPTGDLDDENTRLVMEALRGCAASGSIVIVSTHEADALVYADRHLQMNAGVLEEKSVVDGRTETLL